MVVVPTWSGVAHRAPGQASAAGRLRPGLGAWRRRRLLPLRLCRRVHAPDGGAGGRRQAFPPARAPGPLPVEPCWTQAMPMAPVAGTAGVGGVHSTAAARAHDQRREAWEESRHIMTATVAK